MSKITTLATNGPPLPLTPNDTELFVPSAPGIGTNAMGTLSVELSVFEAVGVWISAKIMFTLSSFTLILFTDVVLLSDPRLPCVNEKLLINASTAPLTMLSTAVALIEVALEPCCGILFKISFCKISLSLVGLDVGYDEG